MAAVIVVPAEICVNRHGDPVGQVTACGRVLQSELNNVLGLHAVVVVEPSWPSVFAPQQKAWPLFVNAQVWLSPALTVVHGSEHTRIGRQWPFPVQAKTSGGVTQSRSKVMPLLGTSTTFGPSGSGLSVRLRPSVRPQRISMGSIFTGLPSGSKMSAWTLNWLDSPCFTVTTMRSLANETSSPSASPLAGTASTRGRPSSFAAGTWPVP